MTFSRDFSDTTVLAMRKGIRLRAASEGKEHLQARHLVLFGCGIEPHKPKHTHTHTHLSSLSLSLSLCLSVSPPPVSKTVQAKEHARLDLLDGQFRNRQWTARTLKNAPRD